uniref:Uncharacterized protein n=1 Tax=Candidatus Kentrum sp. FW TaxID=2126338 RepID=A0A450U3F4_9GAMM|nr:MAG: hypothetical protein BECKFW1821C_GA0114237_11345 [Candidatus Kentron sp. FW]
MTDSMNDSTGMFMFNVDVHPDVYAELEHSRHA